MGESYAFKVVEKAEEMYVVQGYTLDEIAAQLDIARSTIYRWASQNSWTSKKKKYRKLKSQCKISLMILYQKMLEKAARSLDIQDIEAVKYLQEAITNQEEKIFGIEKRQEGKNE